MFHARGSFHPAVAVVCAGLWLLSAADVHAQLSAAAQARMARQIDAVMSDKESWTPAQNKMDTQIILAAREVTAGAASTDVPTLRSTVSLEFDHGVAVDLKGTITDALIEALKAVGGRNFNSHPEYNTVRVTLPVERIEAIAARADVRFVAVAAVAEVNTGAIDSEGDVTHGANTARSTYPTANGAGVKVGVLSNSIDDSSGSLAAAENSGDIDANNLTIVSGQGGSSTDDGEGLAMCEIVHDLAPGSPLVYATGSSTDAQMAANIKTMASMGCKVIIDDITYNDESPFQDSVISQAVDAVCAQGVLYFSSARNSGNFEQGTSSVWEGDFASGGDASSLDHHAGSLFHSFGTNASGQAIVSDLIKNTGDKGGITLFWSDALGQSANDYDLYETDANGNIIAMSVNRQDGAQDPFEAIGTATPGDYVVIVKYAGAARFLHMEVGRLALATGTNGGVRGHNAAVCTGAFSVAAAPAHNAFDAGDPVGPYPNQFSINNKTETFSTDGPRRMFYDKNGNALTPGNFSSSGGVSYAKPDFTAADGVVTTLPSNSGLNPFFGTSAAAPHAGAMAAMMLSYNSTLTQAAAINALDTGVVRISESANTAGTGILLANSIIQAAGPPDTAGGELAFSASKYTVNERAGSVTLSVKREDKSAGTVTVNCATANGTAKSGTDYTAASTTLVWSEGDTSTKTFKVSIKDNGITDGSTRTFTVKLSSPSESAALGTPATATVSILENDPAKSTLAFSASTYSVNEDGSGTVTLHVVRGGTGTGALAVTCATANGTAKAGTDYTATTKTLTWAASDTAEKNFVVPVKDDAVTGGGTRTFTVKLSSPSGATLASPSTATVDIKDNDPKQGELKFTAAADSVKETAGSITLHVERTVGTTGAVSVTCKTVGGTAKAGTDFGSESKTLSWAAGDKSQKSFVVPIKNRGASGGGGLKFTVELASPQGSAVLGKPSTATVTIE